MFEKGVWGPKRIVTCPTVRRSSAPQFRGPLLPGHPRPADPSPVPVQRGHGQVHSLGLAGGWYGLRAQGEEGPVLECVGHCLRVARSPGCVPLAGCFLLSVTLSVTLIFSNPTFFFLF